jgi:nucleotide-binding universal stress UspA family protein
MLNIRVLLHPTDFTELSDQAMRMACALARDYNARLIILHVIPPPVVAYGEGVIPPDPVNRIKECQENLRLLKVPDDNVRAERRLEEGDPATVIVDVAREEHVDMIAMATHGRTGLDRLFAGSVAEQVIRKAPCPVLVTKMPLQEAATANVMEEAAELQTA